MNEKELVGVLKSKLLPEVEDLKKVMQMDEIEDFAFRLNHLADDHRDPNLKAYAALLRQHAENFDVKEIESMLNRFNELANAYDEL